MSNPTIDLSKDLEAWYDLAPRYYDNQRGIVQDKSGYGRHAEASGAPTVGVNGPDDFEAASFDGSDDEFDFGGPIPASEQEMFVIARVDSGYTDNNRLWDAQGSNDGHHLRIAFDDAVFRFYDGGGVFSEVEVSIPTDEWVGLSAGWDGDETFIRRPDGGLQRTSVPDHSQASDNLRLAGINGNSNLPCDIAMFTRWSRVLSDAEFEYLNRLTAPPRSLL